MTLGVSDGSVDDEGTCKKLSVFPKSRLRVVRTFFHWGRAWLVEPGPCFGGWYVPARNPSTPPNNSEKEDPPLIALGHTSQIPFRLPRQHFFCQFLERTYRLFPRYIRGSHLFTRLHQPAARVSPWPNELLSRSLNPSTPSLRRQLLNMRRRSDCPSHSSIGIEGYVVCNQFPVPDPISGAGIPISWLWNSI